MRLTHLLPIFLSFIFYSASAQESSDSLPAQAARITQKYIGAAKAKSAQIEAGIDRQTAKYLNKLQKTETRIAQKLAKLNKPGLLDILGNSQSRYAEIIKKLTEGTGTAKAAGEYLPYIDSLKGSLSFLQNNATGEKLLKSGDGALLNDAVNGVNQLQGKLQNTEMVKQFIVERKQQIRAVLSQYTDLPNSIKRSFEVYNRQAYYYAAQIREYKEMLNDPDKLERRALTLLNQLPAFQAFMKEHSELSGLFNVPGNYGSMDALAGLQTRDMVQQLISNQMGGGPNAGQMFGQQVQAAKQGLDQFKDKLNRLGGSSGDIEMPNFKPNQQKTKPFLKRLEYGTNLQTQRSGYFFPTTSATDYQQVLRLVSK